MVQSYLMIAPTSSSISNYKQHHPYLRKWNLWNHVLPYVHEGDINAYTTKLGLDQAQLLRMIQEPDLPTGLSAYFLPFAPVYGGSHADFLKAFVLRALEVIADIDKEKRNIDKTLKHLKKNHNDIFNPSSFYCYHDRSIVFQQKFVFYFAYTASQEIRKLEIYPLFPIGMDPILDVSPLCYGTEGYSHYLIRPLHEAYPIPLDKPLTSFTCYDCYICFARNHSLWVVNTETRQYTNVALHTDELEDAEDVIIRRGLAFTCHRRRYLERHQLDLIVTHIERETVIYREDNFGRRAKEEQQAFINTFEPKPVPPKKCVIQ